MLKKVIVIFLLSTIALSTTEFCQLLKLHVLVAHYQEHKAENSDLTFFSFLKMHYFNNNPKDADYDKDMKLPFKTTCIEHHVSVYVWEEISIFVNICCEKTKLIRFFEQNRLFSEQNSLPSSYLTSIWQPPQK
jgi:hypothetical protein